MALTVTLLAFIVYLVVPTVFAATVHSRSSMDLARTEPEDQSARAGRKLSEVDFPTNLDEILPIPVIQGINQGRYQVKQTVSRKPYKTVPVRRNRQGASKGTLSMPEVVNNLDFEEKTHLATRLSLTHRITLSPSADGNGLRR